MKRLCKKTDITDIKTIFPWVWDCIMRHKKRYDFQKLLMRNGLEWDDYRKGIEAHDYDLWSPAVRNIAASAAQRIWERDLELQPPKYRKRYDGSSGKIRDIGCESAMQQVFDAIAVHASMPVFNRRMVPQQASSVQGRGQIYGVRMIRRWAMKNCAGMEYAERHGFHVRNRMKWFVKLDVRKCFPSCRSEVFLQYFERDCGNDDLIWLWSELLESHRVDETHQGFMIGALTSQWAAQYMLSFAYHYAMNIKKRPRRGKQENAISHMIMFMDDMMLSGSSRRELKRAAELLSDYMWQEFGLNINPNWHVREFSDRNGIDMMGFVVYPSGKVEIRARDWVKVRRMILRSKHKKYQVSYKQAKRLTAYKGYIVHSDSNKAVGEYGAAVVFQTAQRIVSKEESKRGEKHGQSTVQCGTTENQLHAAS